MKNLNIINPRTDEILTWNEELEQYELTLAFVKSNMDVNFLDDAMTEKRIKKNSRKVYRFILYRAFSGNADYIKLLINHTEEGRKFIRDVLLEQMDADNETAFNDLSNQPAIDMASGREIDRDSLFRNQVSVDTEQIIYNGVAYFGFNIMIQTLFPPMLRSYLRGALK